MEACSRREIRMWFVVLQRDLPTGRLLKDSSSPSTPLKTIYSGSSISSEFRVGSKLCFMPSVTGTQSTTRHQVPLPVDSQERSPACCQPMDLVPCPSEERRCSQGELRTDHKHCGRR